MSRDEHKKRKKKEESWQKKKKDRSKIASQTKKILSLFGGRVCLHFLVLTSKK